ncbi:PilZ domain-containing protein [Methylobacterium sp. A54F]
MRAERRRVPRADLFRIGELWLQDEPEPVDCLVRNISGEGALLEVRTTAGIPETFRLTIERAGLDRPCTVARRTAHCLGVTFAV